jgi:outer membrane receptor protein involved in Fe transport
LQDAPAAKELSAVLGYRHSEYESAGGADAYKAELLYQPVAPLRLRSSFQHAVRAPSVFELFLPQLPTQYNSDPDFGFVDPCDASSEERSGAAAAAVEALCLTQGVPAALLPTFFDTDGEYPGVVGGNPDLDPETADTLAVGIVLQPGIERSLLSALQVSIDWYRIEVSDAIFDTIASDYVPLCFDAEANPGLDPDFAPCHYFSRNAESGEIENLTDIKRNIVGYDVSGIDTQLDWRVDVGPGSFGASWLLAWMDSFEVQQVASLPAVDQVGAVGFAVGGSLPEWKSNLNLSYEWTGLTLTAQWRYIDAMHDRGLTDFEVPSHDYVDLYTQYAFEQGALDGLIIRAGVENLTDQDPPLLPSSLQANTDPSQYDVLGRRYLLSVAYRF